MIKPKLWIIFLVILAIGVFLRFVNYDNRWTLSQDQARDAIIANYAIETGNIPLIGPPSSAGKFSFGPEYYWLIIFFSKLAPSVVNAPWIGFTIISCLSVALLFLIGRELGGKMFASILGILGAFSSALVFHSVDMLNPIPVSFATILTIYFLTKFQKSKSLILSCLMGISIGLAISFHFQALGLLILPFVILLVNRGFSKKDILGFFVCLLGIIVSLFPIIVFNFQNRNLLLSNFLSFSSNSSGIKITAPLGLIKDLFIFWPSLWGEVLVFKESLGYIFYLPLVLLIIYLIAKKIRIEKTILILIITLIGQAIILRFYGGARLPVYLIVFHPFIVFLTGWMIWKIYEIKKIFGVLILGTFLLMSSFSNIEIVKGQTLKPIILSVKKNIDEKHLGSVNLLSKADSQMVSLPLFYLYSKEKRISDDGYKIGACDDKVLENNTLFCPAEPAPFLHILNFSLYDFNERPKGESEKLQFEQVSSQKIYSQLFDYYK